MKKAIKICLASALSAYFIKFLVDILMYVFMINDKNDIYYDLWYLFTPQIISSLLMVGFYLLFFSDRFYGMFFKVSTGVLVGFNLVFILLLYFDKTIGYIYYFSLAASVNFLNALYLKCNIIPVRKPGSMEYIPMLFELVPFVCMVTSLCALFCGFPTLTITSIYRVWEYFDVITSIKLNALSECILCFALILCYINKAEIIRDNMLY